MSTRSTISIKRADGKYRTIYCHHDGYLEYNGKILINNYKTADRVNALLYLGDLSSLGEEPIDYWNDPSLDSDKGCKTYGVLGEYGVEAMIFDNREDIMDYYSDTEYNYFFENGEWYYLPHCTGQPMKVVDALEKMI